MRLNLYETFMQKQPCCLCGVQCVVRHWNGIYRCSCCCYLLAVLHIFYVTRMLQRELGKLSLRSRLVVFLRQHCCSSKYIQPCNCLQLLSIYSWQHLNTFFNKLTHLLIIVGDLLIDCRPETICQTANAVTNIVTDNFKALIKHKWQTLLLLLLLFIIYQNAFCKT